MSWLNYNHLYYFWVVAKEGGIAKAAAKLRRSQPTLSAQLKLFEDQIGEKLFARAGRGIQITDMGREIFRYANDIFTAGESLARHIEGRPSHQQTQFLAGIADALPKFLAYDLLRFALRPPRPLRLVCREDRPERLLPSLALNELDVVLSDHPAGPGPRQKLNSHLLGQTKTSFYAVPALARKISRFPKDLDGAPMLMLTTVSAFRRQIELWLELKKITPRIVGEIEDSALLFTFGQAGHGIFAAPSILAERLLKDRGMVELGQAEGLSQRFYAITNERSESQSAVRELIRSGKLAFKQA